LLLHALLMMITAGAMAILHDGFARNGVIVPSTYYY
jgi:hypothetical protein